MVEVKKILFPVDFTSSSKKVLPFARYLCEKLGASIHLIHVVRGAEDFTGFDMGAAWFASFEQELLKGAEKAMERFIDENLQDFPNGLDKSVVMGDVVEEILKMAGQVGADMIVIGTHGRKGLEKIVFGSVAREVVKRADIPVLTVNPFKTKV